MSFIIKIEDKKGYRKRFTRILLLIVAFSVLVGLFIGTQSEWQWGLGIAIFVFLSQFIKVERSEKYFIEQLTIADGSIEILFTINGRVEVLSGVKEDFYFKKCTTFLDKLRPVYLRVDYRNSLVIEQFLIGDWTEVDIDRIIAAT
ncbi:MAG: hypothetical protein JST82_13005 [Bacteroidetes bacterium]|nr:hypothetical protein [Bacteroidota bacterium]